MGDTLTAYYNTIKAGWIARWKGLTKDELKNELSETSKICLVAAFESEIRDRLSDDDIRDMINKSTLVAINIKETPTIFNSLSQDLRDLINQHLDDDTPDMCVKKFK